MSAREISAEKVGTPIGEVISVSFKRAAELIGCSRSTFYREIIGGRLIKSIDIGARGKVVLVDDLRELLRKLKDAQATAGSAGDLSDAEKNPNPPTRRRGAGLASNRRATTRSDSKALA